MTQENVKQTVHHAIILFGMATGPIAMGNLAGNDISYLIRKERGVTKDPVTIFPAQKLVFNICPWTG